MGLHDSGAARREAQTEGEHEQAERQAQRARHQAEPGRDQPHRRQVALDQNREGGQKGIAHYKVISA